MTESLKNKGILIVWWSELGRHEWPDGFPYPKPVWWDTADEDTQGKMIALIQPAILTILGGGDFLPGFKVVLRAQNMDKTPDEFESYWLEVASG